MCTATRARSTLPGPDPDGAILSNACRGSQGIFRAGDRLVILSAQLVALEVPGDRTEPFFPGNNVQEQYGYPGLGAADRAMGKRPGIQVADAWTWSSAVDSYPKTPGSSARLALPAVDQPERLAESCETPDDRRLGGHPHQPHRIPAFIPAVDQQPGQCDTPKRVLVVDQ